MDDDRTLYDEFIFLFSGLLCFLSMMFIMFAFLYTILTIGLERFDIFHYPLILLLGGGFNYKMSTIIIEEYR